jgi:hypothetical protein
MRRDGGSECKEQKTGHEIFGAGHMLSFGVYFNAFL